MDFIRSREQFHDSTCADQIPIAERELCAFIRAVTRQFGPQQAELAAEDWLDELDLMDSSSLSTDRNWRSLTIAASARLASRLTVPRHRRSGWPFGATIRRVLTRGSATQRAG